MSIALSIENLEERSLLSVLPLGELAVNEYTTGNQSAPRVALHGASDYVVTWTNGSFEGPGGDGNQSGIFAQRFHDNAKVGPEFIVNSITIGRQTNPVIAMDGDGDFVIAWKRADASGVFARRFDGSANPLGPDFIVTASTGGLEFNPAIAMNSSGDFVITWTDSGAIRYKRYNSLGQEQGAAQIASSIGASNSTVAMDSVGNFVIAWTQSRSATQSVVARRFDSNGNSVGAEFLVGAADRFQTFPAIAMDSSGVFVVTWESGRSPDQDFDPTTHDVFARLFDASAQPVGDEFQVSGDFGTFPFVAMVPSTIGQSFVLSWWGGEGNRAYEGINGRRFTYDSLGLEPSGTTFQVSDAQSHFNSRSAVAGDVSSSESTRFIIAWDQTSDIFAERFAVPPSPSAEADAFTVTQGQMLEGAGFLLNDHPASGHANSLMSVLAASPSHAATFLLRLDGTFSYLPALDFVGEDSFSYRAVDSEARQSPRVTVVLRALSKIADPSADGEVFVAREDGVLSGAGLLANDRAGAGLADAALTSVLASAPSHSASFVLRSNGEFDYVPARNFSGKDAFTYRAVDSRGRMSAPAVVTIHVQPVNDAPTLNASLRPTFSPIKLGKPNHGDLVSKLLNRAVSDPDVSALRGIAVIATSSIDGVWQFSLNGKQWRSLGRVSSAAARLLRGTDRIRFVPKMGQPGSASIVYRAWDMTTGTAGARINLYKHGVGGMHAFSAQKETATVRFVKGIRISPTFPLEAPLYWTHSMDVPFGLVNASTLGGPAEKKEPRTASLNQTAIDAAFSSMRALVSVGKNHLLK